MDANLNRDGTGGRSTRISPGYLVLASSVGTIIEWYDFFLYGSLAIVFSRLFYPGHDPVAAMLVSVTAFATGFAVRPLGAVIFGHVGDRLGRKTTFLVTLVVMGISTAAIGLLPTFATAGYLAPVLLVLLRLIQGIALGGEYGGANSYVAEHAPDGARGRWTSYIQTMASGGFLLSLIVVIACRFGFGQEAFERWGWRIPFLLSTVLVVVSVRIRMSLSESPVFLRLKEAGQVARLPVHDAIADPINRRRILLFLFGAACAQATTFYTAHFYALYYIESILKVDFLTATLSVAAGVAIGSPFFVLFGTVSDRIGRKPLMLAGMAAALLFYVPIFMAIRSAVTPAGVDGIRIAIAVFAAVVICAAIYGPYGAFIVENFPSRVRYTSISIPYHVGNGIFGGFLPIVSLTLVTETGNPYAGLIYPMAFCAVGFVITLFFLPETSHRKLSDLDVPHMDNAAARPLRS
ncbi:MHS family MFS transporter [Lichenicola cladoniae]|uniref:MHS family MFS transporter n=1 Tax=Lichenicola cladoniae TaxID=1484109 RepID=A0A6M8HL84_9PROT|nr:MFS transporter [Lichenicola cladoniae]NPD69289.1 MHS family MFS transporter [Acetobacteraceae bacterium]QKE89105.1 MHS family MFS transporter [Lichenicola cladoniae]